MRIDIEVTGSIENVVQNTDAERKKIIRKSNNKGIQQNSTVAEVRRNQKGERRKENTEYGIKIKFNVLKANTECLWSRVSLISDSVGVEELGSINNERSKGRQVDIVSQLIFFERYFS
jgi:hypothetical protein